MTPFIKIDKPIVMATLYLVSLSNDSHASVAYIWQSLELCMPKNMISASRKNMFIPAEYAIKSLRLGEKL